MSNLTIGDQEDVAAGAGFPIEELLEDGTPETVDSFLRTEWFYRAMAHIKAARLRNHLSQADVAAKIGTAQSVVARMENAHSGTFSLNRFLEYAWACGAAPLDIEFVAPDLLGRFALEDLDAWRTRNGLMEWQRPEILGDTAQESEQRAPAQQESDSPRLIGDYRSASVR